MTIDEYLETKEITPAELEENFVKVKELKIDTFSHKGCYNCGDTLNNSPLKIGSWMSAQHCRKCQSINLVYVQDRMGGIDYDVIDVFQERK